jgi:hypothetical protein
MAQRRDRPGLDLAGSSLNVTLPDGRTLPIPRRGDLAGDVCCFCGETVEHADRERVRLSVRWIDGDDEREQSWGAHQSCVLERLNERVKGQGPFFAQA